MLPLFPSNYASNVDIWVALEPRTLVLLRIRLSGSSFVSDTYELFSPIVVAKVSEQEPYGVATLESSRRFESYEQECEL